MIEQIIQSIRDQQAGREWPLQMLAMGEPDQPTTVNWSDSIPAHRSEGFTGLPTEIDFQIAVDEYQGSGRGYVIRIRKQINGEIVELTDQDGPLIWTQQSWRLEIRPKYFEGTFSGWGWRAEMVGGDPALDPGVRSLALYADDQHTQFLYTPGAFQSGQSEFYPGDCWFMESPLGQLTPERTDIHFATLFASIQETKGTLSADADSAFARYWIGLEGEQSPTPPGTDWIDSGATFQSLLGAGVISVSDSSVFSPPQQIRIAGMEIPCTGIFQPGVLSVTLTQEQSQALQWDTPPGTMIEVRE